MNKNVSYNSIKKEFDDINNRRIQLYLRVLYAAAPALNQEQQAHIQNKIDEIKIIIPLDEYLNNQDFAFQEKKDGIVSSDNVFSGRTAIKIRIDAGHLSLASLARELYSDKKEFKCAYSTLRLYEKDSLQPGGRLRKATKTEKYLLWLKKQGYNPFNLP